MLMFVLYKIVSKINFVFLFVIFVLNFKFFIILNFLLIKEVWEYKIFIII